jgi:TatD DNase family protein
MLIDTHAHLYLDEFKEDLTTVLDNAKLIGVNKILFPAINSKHTADMVALENKYPNQIYLMAGLHPAYVSPETMEEELQHVFDNLNKLNVKAVGEIGIDLYWEKNFLKQQQQAFKTQIKWAKEKKLPIVIHCRDSFNEVFEILEEEKDSNLKGVLHCFSGNEEEAKKAITYNLKLGIGGVVTFKNGKIADFLERIDLSHLVLETDSPYLAPVPFRGKRNESAYLNYVVEKLCTIYKKTPTEIAQITSSNAEEIFNLG